VQFHDGVYLVLLMGLLEGYFVPLHHFHLTPTTNDQKVDPSPQLQLNSLDFMYSCLVRSGTDLISLLLLFLLLFLLGHPSEKPKAFISNWIRMKFGKIVLEVNTHQLIMVSRIFDLTSFQDGSHGIISHSKVLPPVEWTHRLPSTYATAPASS